MTEITCLGPRWWCWFRSLRQSVWQPVRHHYWQRSGSHSRLQGEQIGENSHKLDWHMAWHSSRNIIQSVAFPKYSPGLRCSKSESILKAVQGLTPSVAAHNKGMSFGSEMMASSANTASVLHVPVITEVQDPLHLTRGNLSYWLIYLRGWCVFYQHQHLEEWPSLLLSGPSPGCPPL